MNLPSKKMIWFKANARGNGWQPATWQGWLVWGVCIALNLAAGIFFIPLAWHTWTLWLVFAVVFLLINAGFLWVCFKTGEPVQLQSRKTGGKKN